MLRLKSKVKCILQGGSTFTLAAMILAEYTQNRLNGFNSVYERAVQRG